MAVGAAGAEASRSSGEAADPWRPRAAWEGGSRLADHLGLVVRDVPAPADANSLVAMLKETAGADVLNFTSFLDESLIRVIYASADAVLANSGTSHSACRPRGDGGRRIAVTARPGDYAEPYRNALVLETDDPLEIVTELAC